MHRFSGIAESIRHFRHVRVPAALVRPLPLNQCSSEAVEAPKHVVNRFFRTCSVLHAYNPSNVPNPGYLLIHSFTYSLM